MRKYFSLLVATICFCVSAYGLAVRQLLAIERNVSASQQKMSVVIDAGHGGIDGGVTGVTTGIKESDLNLSIAYILKDLFSDAGFLVTMTRKTQSGLSDGLEKWTKKRDMQKRKEIIQTENPDFVLSIHQNFLPSSSSTRGAQVFYAQDDEQSKSLALQVQETLNTVYSQRGVKNRNAVASKYYILECTNAPSLIIECGFLSSPEDENLLCNDLHRKQIAQAIFSGVTAELAKQN